MEFKEEIISALRKKANGLPLVPGVYLMKDKNNKIIYIGKSKAMKNRVSSYFSDLKSHTVKTAAMVSLVADFDYILTDTNIEALALENRLIKLHKPKFNIKLKDSKTYPYIKLSLNTDYPRLIFTRRRLDDGAKYFGPYSGSSTALALMKTAQKAFGLASCNRKFPQDIGKERPCIYKQIGQCTAPCDNSISKEEYFELNKKAASFLSGSYAEVKNDLEQKMNAASENLNFEAAAKYRDRIRVLEACKQKQKAVSYPGDEKDVIAIYYSEFCTSMSVFFIRDGSIADTENVIFTAEEIVEDSDIISFLCDFYKKREFIPQEILLDFYPSDESRDDFTEYLKAECGARVSVRSPERGDAKQLCAMVRENAKDAARLYSERNERQNETAVRLARLLSLEVVPELIEAFDISNMGADNITAGKISSENGKLNKKAYRSYKIKGSDGQDDYASMREAVRRRLSHKEDKYPDLILLDGGMAHVSVIRKLLDVEKIHIPVFGMVKDEFHKTRALTDDKS
jgi:excinuclease ABC subunit C